jgi:hypothetical protein
MLYCSNNKNIYHIHIPRTGGRYVRNIFSENLFNVYHNNFGILVNGIEAPHLHYPLYNLLDDVENAEHFAVVRDPFEKFKSTIQLVINGRQYPSEVYNLIRDKDWLFGFLNYEKEVGLYAPNAFRPQCEFISKHTKIYKFENGLNENIIKWLNNSFDIHLKNKNFSYPKSPAEMLKNTSKIDNSIKPLIQEYYAKDYEVFNYQ